MKSFKKLVTVIAMLTIAFSAIAQNVTIKANQVRLETVLDQITSQTGYSFVHSRPAVNPDQLVTLEVSGVSVEAALQKLFAGTSIVYEIQDKKVYLKEKSHQATATPAKKKVTGVVVDDAGLPVIGAGVVVKGTTRGASTGIDGEFSLEVSPEETLIFSSIGYDTVEILVGQQTELNITMSENSTLLQDVVVVGYGTQKKVNLTGAVSVIEGKDLNSRPVTNTAMALQGADPSLLLTTGNGSIAGDQYSVSIRGAVSLNSGDPLILIDGIEGSLSQVNPNDIESISVLKDASACAVYGAKASAGVILVNTKNGADGVTKISYNGRFSISENTTTTDFMTSSYDYVTLTNEFYNYLRLTG